MRCLPLCGLILVRVRGHAVEVLLFMLPAASAPDGLAGWLALAVRPVAMHA